MNLHDAIAHCRVMVNQANNGNSPVITEEDEVIESNGYSSYSSNSVRHNKLDVWSGPYGEQQVWAILVADSSGSSLSAAMYGGSFSVTPTAKSDEIGIVLMDKSGDCRAIMAKALDYSWKRIDKPDMFWTHGWAKAVHDVVNGITRTKPDMLQTQYGAYKVGDLVEITQRSSINGSKGKILALMSYRNAFGNYREPMVLVGDTSTKNVFHVVEFNEIASSSGNKDVDKNQKKEDTEAERMLKFFASSQHDPKSPWYTGSGNERK